MSLTRKQWEEMWEDAKLLERYISQDVPGHVTKKRRDAALAVVRIKDQIQSVIGQME